MQRERLSDCYEWNLLQRLAAVLPLRKFPYQPSIRDWKDATSNAQHYRIRSLEVELREIFISREADDCLTHRDLEECRQKLGALCRLLEEGVDSKFTKMSSPAAKYPRLAETIDFFNDVNVDFLPVNLASGPSQPLFNIGQQQNDQEKWLRCVTDCNKLIGQVLYKRVESSQESVCILKDDAWRDSGLRDHASATFRLLFQRISCGASHEVLMKFLQTPNKSQGTTLQLLLSSCAGKDKWQEIQCKSGKHDHSTRELHDLCSEIKLASDQSQQLRIFAKERQLFGNWALQSIGRPSPPASHKHSLDAMVAAGWFKPMTSQPSSGQLDRVSSDACLNTKQKRALAVKLGYCLLDFFDADLKPSTIYFLGQHEGHIATENIFLSFSSRLPSSPERRIFKMGHPVLLSFAKILLELDDGVQRPIEISSCYGDRNENIWFEFMKYADKNGSRHSDLYIEAFLGCLIVHSQLCRVNADSPEADMEIRQALYQHIVRKLELELKNCSPRPQGKRQRSSSPPALDNSGYLERPDTVCTVRELPVPISRGRETEPDRKRIRRSETRMNGLHSCLPVQTTSGQPALVHTVQTQASDVSSEKWNPQILPLVARANDRPPNRDSFEIAIVCALPREHNAISLLFEHFWDAHGNGYGRAARDPNIYKTGRIGNLDAVLLLLPEMGKVNAASAARGLHMSFGSLKLVLLCGICGGVPNLEPRLKRPDEILLGDVIISQTMMQYDLGRRYLGSFEAKNDIGTGLGRPTKLIRSILALLQGEVVQQDLRRRSANFLEQIQLRGQQYQYPGANKDRLFQASYLHKHRLKAHDIPCADCCARSDAACVSSRDISCDELGCEKKYLVSRHRLERNQYLEEIGEVKVAQVPSIFLGCFGSGDTVLKSGEDRESMAKEHGILAVEMEGAGIWDEVPCIVVKGVCDYADSHKNKDWQDFAAATSASVVKALLELY